MYDELKGKYLWLSNGVSGFGNICNRLDDKHLTLDLVCSNIETTTNGAPVYSKAIPVKRRLTCLHIV